MPTVSLRYVVTALTMGLSGATLAIPGLADGGISLGQTRIVFISTDRAQVLGVKNSGQERFLIQSRVQMAPGNTLSAPFVVTPPLFTLQPDSRQQLRIVSMGGALPKDRESLFWLSVLAIPAQKVPDTEVSKVSMGMRFGMKLFYRPVYLGAGPQACSLQIRAQSDGVLIDNPTPFFQTFGQLVLNNKPVSLDIQSSMLAPYSSQRYPTESRVIQAQWQTIDDYGVLTEMCHQTVSSAEGKT